MEEIWKDIPGYEGIYKISNLGKIKALRIWTGRMYIKREVLLKPTIARNGYYRITLSNNKKVKYVNMHRLIAETFIPNPNNYSYINHIDGNKQNNNINNLEWCTQSHNIKEAVRIGLRKTKTRGESPNSRKVNQYDLSGNLIKEWNSMVEINEELGFDYTCISRCCSGIYKKSYGFIWKYREG